MPWIFGLCDSVLLVSQTSLFFIMVILLFSLYGGRDSNPCGQAENLISLATR